MPSLFSRIISGEVPSHTVWRDESCVAFLSIEPITPGHTLVVPRQEVDHWLDLEAGMLHHLATVAQTIGRSMHRAFPSEKVGLMLAGLEVPHVHIHVLPIDGLRDLSFANASHAPDAELAAAATRLREQLVADGHAAHAQA